MGPDLRWRGPTMPPKYDVAISFLSADEATAAALHSSLSVGLEVFFYPRRQEELAGTNGLESMRAPFLSESRIVVVLYRDPWGKTPWTRVEQSAIQDGCLKCGWQRLFFVMLDRASEPPLWLPNAHVRFNYADFGLEQAVGAIKARVQELGGTIAPLTALKRAELSKQETQYLKEKEQLRSPVGREMVGQKATELFSAIESLCAEINASKNATIQVASDPRNCHLRNNRVSLFVTLADPYSESCLVVREFNNRLAFRGEHLFYPDGEPKRLSEKRFLPEMNRARECGWVEDGQPSRFLSSESLADNIVGQFIDLAARADRGEFKVSLG
jgi:hypothetical protein